MEKATYNRLVREYDAATLAVSQNHNDDTWFDYGSTAKALAEYIRTHSDDWREP